MTMTVLLLRENSRAGATSDIRLLAACFCGSRSGFRDCFRAVAGPIVRRPVGGRHEIKSENNEREMYEIRALNRVIDLF